MTKIMKGGIAYNSTSNMVALTQAEYNTLSPTQKNNGTFYFITDADPSYYSAANIDYSNTSSGLSATNVQSAIDEVVSDIPSNNDFSLSGLSDTVISSPLLRNVLQFDGTNWINSIPNLLVGDVASTGSIRSILVATSIPKGVYFYNTRYATDNPATNTLSFTLIYKNNANGNYSRCYCFAGETIYYSGTSSSVPSSLSWSIISQPSIVDITSDVTFTESISGTNTKFYVKNNVVYINYQGPSKTHASGDVLFTLPAGYRPQHLLYTPFVVNGLTFGNFEIATNGQAKINQINDSTKTGRIYSTVSFPV